MRRCTNKCVGVCVQVCKHLPTCEGTWRQVAWALLVELLPPPPNPVCPAAEVWSRRQCEEITISSSGRIYRKSHILSLCSAPWAGCAPCHRQEPGLGNYITCQIRDCQLPGPGATGTVKETESDWGCCVLAKKLGVLEGSGQREVTRTVLVAEVPAGVQQWELKANPHWREWHKHLVCFSFAARPFPSFPHPSGWYETWKKMMHTG